MPNRFRVCAAFLALACALSARAQTIRLPHVATGAPQSIVLPKVIVAGERATLAVLDAKGVLVPAADVALSSGAQVTTDDTGRALFTAPAQMGALTAKSVETGASATSTVLALPKVSASGLSPSPSSTVVFPNLIVLGDRFDVFSAASDGSGFSGDANLDRVTVGNLPALILAASPVSVVALPNPHTSAGFTEFSAGLVSRKPDPQRVTVIVLRVTGPAAALAPGERNALALRVDGSPERLPIEVRNLTPETVDFGRGNVEHLVTSGGAANIAMVAVSGVKAGDYSVAARLEPYVDPPAIAAARLELLAAKQVADASWQKRLDHLIQEMNVDKEHSPRDAARFRQEIEKMVRGKPAEAVAGLLRLAWQSLGAEN